MNFSLCSLLLIIQYSCIETHEKRTSQSFSAYWGSYHRQPMQPAVYDLPLQAGSKSEGSQAQSVLLQNIQ